MNNDNRDTWQALDDSGAAGLVGRLMEHSASERYSIMDSLYTASQEKIERLEAELRVVRPLAKRFLQIQRALAPIDW